MNPLRRLWRRLRPPVLALGGGGARGFAHIGVLEVLERERVPFRGIAGTSMGAVIGAMYLHWGSAEAVRRRWEEAFERELVPDVPTIDMGGAEPDEATHPLLQLARRVRDRIVISVAVNRTTVADEDRFAEWLELLEHLLPGTARIEELPRPFVAVATDLEDGSEVRLRRGPLREAVRASASIPGLVPPVELEGRLLVDGGVVAEVPVGAAAEIGRPVVAVDVSMELPPHRPDALVLHTTFRTGLMTARLLRRYQLEEADTVLRPEVGARSWADWKLRHEFVEAGRRAAERWLGAVAAGGGAG